MPKYNVTIVETLKKTVEVEAESPEEAECNPLIQNDSDKSSPNLDVE